MDTPTTGESDVQSQGREVRGRNFVDVVSQDVTIGIGQRAVTFWDRVTVHYNENRLEETAARPARSLETK
jgi:hypothetical protein